MYIETSDKSNNLGTQGKNVERALEQK